MSGTTTEPDLAGRGHVARYAGSTPASATAPNGDKVAVFNGGDSYLSVISAADLSIANTGRLTWEAWIRPTTLQFATGSGGYTDWMGKCDSYAPTCEWEARMYAATNSEKRCSRLSAYVFNPSAGLGSGADWQPTCGGLSAGQWLYVVGEYQTLETPAGCDASYPGTVSIWVNGVPWSAADHRPTGCMSQYKVLPRAGSSNFLVGTMAKDMWFSGAIGKVAVYGALLSQEQVSSHYRAMTGSDPAGSCRDSCFSQKVS